MHPLIWKRQSSATDELVSLFEYQQTIILCASAVLMVLVYDTSKCSYVL